MKAGSDEQLMQAVGQGNAAALSELVERHYQAVLGYLYRVVGGNSPLAEDLAQETFVRLLQQNSYQPGRAFKPWLYTIATNLSRDYFKSAAARRNVADEAAMLEMADETDNPETIALSAEQGRDVAESVRALGWEQRTAVILRYYHDLSLAEIAEVLNVPVGTVKSRLYNGTQRLRSLLTHAEKGTSSGHG